MPHPLHGTTGIASEFTLTLCMKGTPKTAKFLGIESLAKPYSGHRLHVREGLLHKFGLKKDILYQDDSVVNLLIGSNSSSLFPTVLHQQANVIIAQSKFTSKYLIQGATKFLGFPNQYLAAQTLQLNTLQFNNLQPHEETSATLPRIQAEMNERANFPPTSTHASPKSLPPTPKQR